MVGDIRFKAVLYYVTDMLCGLSCLKSFFLGISGRPVHGISRINIEHG